MQKLQDENKNLKKQAEEAEEAEKKNKEKFEHIRDAADEHFRQHQRVENKIQQLKSDLKTETRLKEDALDGQRSADARADDVLNRARQQSRASDMAMRSAWVNGVSWATQRAMQPHGYIQPGQMLPVQNTYPGPFQPSGSAPINYPAPMHPSGPDQNNQNMCGPYRNFSDPHPEMYSVTNTTQVTNESRISDIPRDNNPGPSRQQHQNSSGPRPRVDSTTGTAHDSGESSSSHTPRDNIPEPSRQPSQHSSGPRPSVDSTTDTIQDSGSSSSSDTLRDDTPEPSRRPSEKSSSPRPREDSTTDNTQDSSSSSNSHTPRDNAPESSQQPNQNSPGPDPKANNTVNNAKNTKESRSPRISRNNYPGPSSCGPIIVNSVNLEYIWYTDPVDNKDCESIRVSRGMENNVAAKVPYLDYVWAANVDNLQALINLYNHTPGTKASIIMVKHIDARVSAGVRLDWRLFASVVS
ncbi:hypothetical protein NW766_000792 [Fusarium irregulare]|uniref:Uncharacterized protein n=1 Tax=Fusarium irregulare TaxID=2494466 RepID=A0A9W8Q0G9_9HYPO|nr:hypothetical protein NW766_000792 [Fusarium irregulare]